MSATFHWGEDNGAATGSPTHGTTRGGIGNTSYPTDANWKSVDDNTANSGTAYSAAPIIAGNNSYEKWQYGIFSGAYNSIIGGPNAFYAHTSGVPGTGLTIKGAVGITYTTPAQTANASLTTDMTTAITITSSGLNPQVQGTGPEQTGANSTTSNPAYTRYLVTQLQTTTSAAPGDCPSQVLTLQYQENSQEPYYSRGEVGGAVEYLDAVPTDSDDSFTALFRTDAL